MKYLFIILLFTHFSVSAQEHHPWDEKKPIEKKDTNHYFSIPDTNIVKYSLPDHFNKPKGWMKYGLIPCYESDFDSTITDLHQALAILDTETGFFKVAAAAKWCYYHYDISFPYLVARLSEKKKIGITGAGDLLLWNRIETGELEFYGHGGGGPEDIFTVAGRASWVLDELTWERFAVVHITLTPEQAEQYKQQWVKYIRRLKKTRRFFRHKN
jgi:hypothetical protein